MHYEKSWFGLKTISRADGQDFFASGEGKFNPQSELEANLRAFFSAVDDRQDSNDHALCRFPARLRWLRERLKFKNEILPQPDCRRFDEFKQRMDPESVSIVFSSFFMNSPASIFGHSFLRLNKRQSSTDTDQRKSELLDYGINFAANAPDTNPLFFAVGGIVGAFPGVYTAIPYYYKVREYNDFEARDLWSYELDLTQEEVGQLLNHIWELGQTSFDYYFFTENCSYQILTAIEAAAPRLNILDELPPWIIPSDTILAVNNIKGLVKRTSFRPSIRRTFYERLRDLDEREQALLREMVTNRSTDTATSIDPDRQLLILDTLSDYIDYRHPQLLVAGDSSIGAWKHRVLLERARISRPSPTLKIAPKEEQKVHRAHDSARVGLFLGTEAQKGDFLGIDFRFALQDFLDSSVGYPQNAQIEFLHSRIEASKKGSSLEDLALVRVTSYSPKDEFSDPWSWRMEVGAKTYRDGGCDQCLGGYFGVGRGKTFSLKVLDSWIVFFLLDSVMEYSNDFAITKWRLGLGPRVGTICNFSANLKGIIEGYYFRYPFSENLAVDRLKIEVRWQPKEGLALGFSSGVFNGNWSGEVGVFQYF
jgi:hypothetical protein